MYQFIISRCNNELFKGVRMYIEYRKYNHSFPTSCFTKNGNSIGYEALSRGPKIKLKGFLPKQKSPH
jgi:hypothetical protein